MYGLHKAGIAIGANFVVLRSAEQVVYRDTVVGAVTVYGHSSITFVSFGYFWCNRFDVDVDVAHPVTQNPRCWARPVT